MRQEGYVQATRQSGPNKRLGSRNGHFQIERYAMFLVTLGGGACDACTYKRNFVLLPNPIPNELEITHLIKTSSIPIIPTFQHSNNGLRLQFPLVSRDDSMALCSPPVVLSYCCLLLLNGFVVLPAAITSAHVV